MPLDRQLDPPTTVSQPSPRLYDLQIDPAEKQDLAAAHPEIAKSLAEKHDLWFNEVIADWQQSRDNIVQQDRVYWKARTAPDPTVLFKDYWQWKAAPPGTDANRVDPLMIFCGYWCNDKAE